MTGILKTAAAVSARPCLNLLFRKVGSSSLQLGDDAAGYIGTTIFHPVRAARTGTANDPLAMVDERLRFYSIGALRVVDASIMPTITSGNTNTPTAMIAEKSAGLTL